MELQPLATPSSEGQAPDHVETAVRITRLVVVPHEHLRTAFKLGEKPYDPVEMSLNDLYTTPAKLAGLPGMSLPCGFDAKGLPIGLQLVGNYFSEAKMLNVAHQYQRATDWHSRQPEGLK